MKKTLGVVAAAVMAAAPAVAVFAEDLTAQTDNLKVTIDKVCSFGHEDTTAGISVDAPSHTPGTGDYGGTWDGNTDTLSGKFATGTLAENFGSTKLEVYCNNENGYTITASGAAALAASGIDDTIAIGTPATTASAWSYKVAVGVSGQRGVVASGHTTWATTDAIANSKIAESPTDAPKTTTNEGDSFIITYGVGIDNTQSAGTYTGSITYTLAAL